MPYLVKQNKTEMTRLAPPDPDDLRTASVLNMTAAIWLIVSPLMLGYLERHVAIWNTVIIGVLVLIFGWIRTITPNRHVTLSWLNALLGLWCIVSPFVLGYTAFPAPTWNNVLVGAFIAYMSIRNVYVTPASTEG